MGADALGALAASLELGADAPEALAASLELGADAPEALAASLELGADALESLAALAACGGLATLAAARGSRETERALEPAAVLGGDGARNPGGVEPSRGRFALLGGGDALVSGNLGPGAGSRTVTLVGNGTGGGPDGLPFPLGDEPF